MKICSKCEQEYYAKDLCKFHYNKSWNQIHKEKNRIDCKIYYQKNREKILEHHKIYNLENKEKIQEYYKKPIIKEQRQQQRKIYDNEHRVNNNIINKQWKQQNKEKINLQRKIYYEKNKEKELLRTKFYYQINKQKVHKQRQSYKNNRRKNDINFKLQHVLGVLIRQKLKAYIYKKSNYTIDLLGCNMIIFKQYLEQKFTSNMSWNNYGIKGWHLDHIIPCAYFDLNDIEQQKLCFHYTNYQPLWWIDNLKKSYTIEEDG